MEKRPHSIITFFSQKLGLLKTPATPASRWSRANHRLLYDCMNEEDAFYSVLDSNTRLSRLSENHQTPHGTTGPMPSCHTLNGEKVPCSCGCHWKRCCPEAPSSGVKAFGHSRGEYPFKTSLVASGTRESVLQGQTTFAVHGLFFSLTLVCKKELSMCAGGRGTQETDWYKVSRS